MGIGPIELKFIPVCVILPDNKTRLIDWFTRTDAIVNGGISDGRFTDSDFESAKGNPQTAKQLRYFEDFSQFADYIQRVVASQMCKKECHSEIEGGWRQIGDGQHDTCIAPPAPELPPLPEPIDNGKKRTANKSPDISRYKPNPPAWFEEIAPEETEEAKVQPRIANGIASQILAGGTQVYLDMVEPVMDTSDLGPNQWSVSFDGKYFLFSARGCYFQSAEDRRCIAPWSFFTANFMNISSRDSKKVNADVNGIVYVRLKAKKGDVIEVYGRDSATGESSINKLVFKITPDGDVELIRSVDIA